MTSIPASQFPQIMERIVRGVESEPMPDAMGEMVDIFHEGVFENFVRMEDSEHVPWPDFSDNYPRPNHELMIDPADEYSLLSAAAGRSGGSTEIEDRAFEAGVGNEDHPGAALHNFGGIIGGFCAGAIMPAREYLYANDESLDGMADVLADKVTAIVADAVNRPVT